VEASWKYVLIGSVGIALAFAGTVAGVLRLRHAGRRETSALSWTLLRDVAPALNPRVLDLAFVFILIGYGTRPAWPRCTRGCPTRTRKPRPRSGAMMSGVRGSGALRDRALAAVVRAAVGHGFADDVIGLLGVLSLAVGSLSLVTSATTSGCSRTNRASSTPGSSASASGSARSALRRDAPPAEPQRGEVDDVPAGRRVLRRYRTAEIDGVAGLLRVMPWTGGFLRRRHAGLLGRRRSGCSSPSSRWCGPASRPGARSRSCSCWRCWPSLRRRARHLNRMLYGGRAGNGRWRGRALGALPARRLPGGAVVLGLTVRRR